MLRKVIIRNFRIFQDFSLDFTDGMNIVVGDNDTGKSSLLEALNLALTGRLHGRLLAQEISPYLFNLKTTAAYCEGLRTGTNPNPPEFLIDLFFTEAGASVILQGTNNCLTENAYGVRYRVSFNEDFSKEYENFIKDPASIYLIPTEYYKAEWLGFSGNGLTPRSIPAAVSLIDASTIRLQSGADYYLQGIISDHLEPVERVELTRAYRSLREKFAKNESIEAINAKLAASDSGISSRTLSLGVDISQKSAWESSLIPHLDELPFTYLGKGEQSSLKILLALDRKVEDAHVILIEEPENHLSFSTMNILVNRIAERCEGRQVLVATHSSYVLNKLGLANLVLLSDHGGTRLESLSAGTQDYFRKLSGYDTLRLILAKAVILVEGPSDELIVQRAYLDRYGKLPIEDGIDVLNVRGLSFKRFLELARPLKKRVTVITDNDGKEPSDVLESYSDFTSEDFISVHVGAGPTLKTLEPQLLASNDRNSLNAIFKTSHTDDAALLNWMTANKTTCALAIFEADVTINMPGYITNAIS